MTNIAVGLVGLVIGVALGWLIAQLRDSQRVADATGADLEKAKWLAVELETIAKQYYLSLALGQPHILGEAEIAETARGFST